VWFVVPALLAFGLIVAPVGTGVLVGGGLSGAAAGFGLLAALGDRREVRGAYDVLGALARMFNAALILLDQVRGPRDQVRNPLLKKVLELADRMAGLFAQALGAIAVLIVWVGPALVPAARLLTGLGALAESVFVVLGETVDALLANLDALGHGPLSVRAVFARVIEVAKRQLPIAQQAMTDGLALLAKTFGKVGDEVGAHLDVFATAVTAFVTGLFTDHPFGRVMMALRTEIKLLTADFAIPAAPKKPKPAGDDSPDPVAVLTAAIPPMPPLAFPSLPPMPDVKRLRAGLGDADLPALTGASIRRYADEIGLPGSIDVPELSFSADAAKALDAVTKQPSVFARRKPLAEALTVNAHQLEEFRESFSVVVGRVLPPELRGTGTELLAKVFAAVGHHVHGAKERTVDADRLPVLDLPEDDRLQPVVPRLVLRTFGTTLGEARRFQGQLTERLQKQSYRVGPAAPVGAGAR
jgi:hypothetical protein